MIGNKEAAERGRARRLLERSIDELPVLPTVIAKLMVLNRDAEDFFDSLLELVESEPNFSIRILAAANSSVSASRSEVSTVRGALTRIGSFNASSRLLAFAVTRVFVPRDDWEKSLWRHALQVACLAKVLAKDCEDPMIDPDEAYMAGLLHDVGRFLMFMSAPEKLREVDESSWHEPEELLSMEKAICGLTHSELGAMACHKWQLPNFLCDIVQEHHSPEQGDTKMHKLLSIIHLADMAMFRSVTPGSTGLHDVAPEELEELLAPYIPSIIGGSAEDLRKPIQRASEDAEIICSMLGLG